MLSLKELEAEQKKLDKKEREVLASFGAVSGRVLRGRSAKGNIAAKKAADALYDAFDKLSDMAMESMEHELDFNKRSEFGKIFIALMNKRDEYA